MKTSDSSWHRQLSEIGENVRDTQSTYWLHPFETYKTFCPYLVGSYQSVAAEVARYAENGYRTVILDTPPSKDELGHIKSVFSLARQMVMR